MKEEIKTADVKDPNEPHSRYDKYTQVTKRCYSDRGRDLDDMDFFRASQLRKPSEINDTMRVNLLYQQLVEGEVAANQHLTVPDIEDTMPKATKNGIHALE